MQSTQIFRESPFKALKIIGILLSAVSVFFIYIAFSNETPQINAEGLNFSALLLVIQLGIFAGFMLLTFLILSFQYRKRLKCDFEGCEVTESTYWGKSKFSPNRFRWHEVKDTTILERVEDAGEGIVTIYTFAVENDKEQINLLDLKTSSQKNIQGLINYVNKATPHLKYVWLKNKEIGNRLASDSKYGYSKVDRI